MKRRIANVTCCCYQANVHDKGQWTEKDRDIEMFKTSSHAQQIMGSNFVSNSEYLEKIIE